MSGQLKKGPSVGTAYALGAAVLFGIAAPFAKRYLTDIPAIEASGLLYTSAGLVLALAMAIRGGRAGTSEARLRRADVPYLAGAAFFGGLLGPALLLMGLAHATGTVASLLLNLEAVFTVLIALALGESLDRRAGLGILAILAGSMLLAVEPGALGAGSLLGVAAIGGACLSWGIDNNVTQKLSGRDPLAIVAVKGLVAGPIALGLAALTGAPWPSGQTLLAGLVLGASGYGLSLVCFVYALRHAGTARTGSLFATAPFVGAAASVVFLHEPFGVLTAVTGALMAVGVVLMLGEDHGHEHAHEALEHDHVHVHDEHHQHAHDGTEGPEPHSHLHRHGPLTHSHPHSPDLHHRHRH
ncbi:MAG: EamA family transporter [Cyanobacteria bacterium RYN_339]|nr:EamA family transporter [Cyanobacteria bacterium RYN_339]